MNPPPSPPGFAEFHRLVVGDPALFVDLAGLTDVDAFVERAVAAGAAHGCVFGPDDVRAALQGARRTWLERNLP